MKSVKVRTPPDIQCGLVLLAAGESRRMGQPKQLLPIDGRPLLRHVAELVLQAPVDPVVVVLGSGAAQIEPALAGLRVHVAINPDWAQGLGSSLRVGVAAARQRAPALSALIVALADQPTLPPQHLDALIARYRAGGCTAVASLTGDERVPPLLFGRSWFERLGRIDGDTGARALLRNHPEDVATVPLATNADLDTPEDYARYTDGDPRRKSQ
jgi:molybdenum cofactor cytidylyltransferase